MLKRTELKILALWFVLWRGLLFGVGILAPKLLFYRPSFPYAVEFPLYQLPAWVYSWSNFDGIHYLTIIKKGYFGTALIQAFFPLYPNLARFINQWHSPIIAGLIISNIFAFLTLISLYQIGKIYFPKVTWLSLLIFLTFPTSFFFGALYTESLFLVLVLQAFIATHHRRWWLAVLLAGLASATRIIGIFVIFGVVIDYLFVVPTIWQLSVGQLKKTLNILQKRWLKIGAMSLIGASGLLLYMTYLQFRFGDALYFIHVQSEFGGGRQESLVLYPQVVWRYIKILLTARPFDFKYFAYVQEALAGTIGLLFLYFASKKVKLGQLAFCVGAFFLPALTGTFSSYPRYVLVIWPIYFLLAEKLQSSRWQFLYFPLSIGLLILNTVLFIQGYWVA